MMGYVRWLEWERALTVNAVYDASAFTISRPSLDCMLHHVGADNKLPRRRSERRRRRASELTMARRLRASRSRTFVSIAARVQ
jgi:hypothetical protein